MGTRVIVIGGGLAGLAASAALESAGCEVDLYEARPFLGGRATSFQGIDNCQHVLLACFDNLLDLYRRLGVADRIAFHREFYFVEPGGRTSVLQAGGLPAPIHLLGSFARLKFLSASEKLAIARALRAIARERAPGGVTMLDWLREHGQPPRAISRFWGQVLISAINEDLDRMAAAHGFQVFRTAFLGDAGAYRMGLATVPLADLYSAAPERVRVHLRAPVERICERGIVIAGEVRSADFYIATVPFERTAALGLPVATDGFEHSPITGIHLWFNRPVMRLPHATLLDRTIQWAFNKGEGRYVQVVVSASRSLLSMGRQEVIDLALRELADFFPEARGAALERAQVVKEARATFSATPEVEALRPPAATSVPNLFLAGDWTRTGWPATMEGAVRSGYLAAEAVTAAAGKPSRFVR